jgi:hypothetical protein
MEVTILEGGQQTKKLAVFLCKKALLCKNVFKIITLAPGDHDRQLLEPRDQRHLQLRVHSLRGQPRPAAEKEDQVAILQKVTNICNYKTTIITSLILFADIFWQDKFFTIILSKLVWRIHAK